MVGTLALGALVGFSCLLAMGVWVAVASLLVGVVILIITTGWSTALIFTGTLSWAALNSPIWVCVPLFVFMGVILVESRLGDRVYTGVAPFLDHFPGGLLYANIIGGAMFAATSGSSLAAAATIGKIALPTMLKRGFPFQITAGTIGAGALLAPLIPPSLHAIFYASITEQSIGRLFIAGMVPGLILAGIFIVHIAFWSFSTKSRLATGEQVPWGTSIVRVIAIWPIVVLIVMVLGSIFAGIATASEAAAVGAFGAVFLAVIYRSFSWQVLKKATLDTMSLTCQLLFINVAVKVMQGALARAGIISFITDSFVNLPVPPVVILSMICLVFLFLGCFVADIPVLMMVVPVVYPTIRLLGYDPIWFGVVVTLLCLASALTPPVGIVLFVLQALAPERPLTEIYKGILPFIFTTLLMLVILVAFPQLALWLPNVMMGK